MSWDLTCSKGGNRGRCGVGKHSGRRQTSVRNVCTRQPTALYEEQRTPSGRSQCLLRSRLHKAIVCVGDKTCIKPWHMGKPRKMLFVSIVCACRLIVCRGCMRGFLGGTKFRRGMCGRATMITLLVLAQAINYRSRSNNVVSTIKLPDLYYNSCILRERMNGA